MTNHELYLKKQKAISDRRVLEQHGNNYDNVNTVCFAFILLALATAGASFFFMVSKPANISQILLWMAYIGAGIALFFSVTVIIVRLVHRHSRKPLIQAKRLSLKEYEQAIRSMLKYDYGLVPVDDADFAYRIYMDTLGDSDYFIVHAASLDGSQKVNLTLREFDEDALVFTKYGVPYRTQISTEEEPMITGIITPLENTPVSYEDYAVNPEMIPRDEARQQADSQTL